MKTVQTRNATVERIRYYDGDYDEDSTAAGVKKYHYIHAQGGLIGIFVQEGSADTMYHVLSDHLGSLTGIINEETDEVTNYSYNAWGEPRDPEDWTAAFDGELFAGRGYTGHEHLTEFNLINMNGRVYDPVLARFMSPDPFVQFPGYVNSYNRYAYVLNRPLNFVDPSGYLTEEALIAIINYLGGLKYGGSYSTSAGFTAYSSHEDAITQQNPFGSGGGSWQPVYGGGSFSGTPGHIENKKLQYKNRYRWIPGTLKWEPGEIVGYTFEHDSYDWNGFWQDTPNRINLKKNTFSSTVEWFKHLNSSNFYNPRNEKRHLYQLLDIVDFSSATRLPSSTGYSGPDYKGDVRLKWRLNTGKVIRGSASWRIISPEPLNGINSRYGSPAVYVDHFDNTIEEPGNYSIILNNMLGEHVIVLNFNNYEIFQYYFNYIF